MACDYKISILGGGNLGSAIGRGLLESGWIKPSGLYITRRHPELMKDASFEGVSIGAVNTDAVHNADIVLVCVQPGQAAEVFREIAASLMEKAIVISVVSGLAIDTIKNYFADSLQPLIYRAMPNTAVSVRESMTLIAGEENCPEAFRVSELFNHLGSSIFIEERLMNASTVLAASGIAYAMRYIRAATEGGIELGFEPELALKIVAQTVKGASGLLLKKGTHPECEIDRVSTPGGCTITGLNTMEQEGFSASVVKGLTKSFEKIVGGRK